ncbi:MAG TPA: ABC transporter transmembrane domain-containing protein [Actinospica sp.]|nr:ABC transporter transmembrane domain-containing protein [Actinospica sp.]
MSNTIIRADVEETAVVPQAEAAAAPTEQAPRDEPTTAPPEDPGLPAAQPDSAAVSLRSALGSMRGLLRPRRLEIGVASAMLVVAGAIGLLQPLAVEWLLVAFAQRHGVSGRVATLVVLVLVDAVLMAIGNYLLMRAAEGVVFAGRLQLTQHLLRLTMPAMRRQATGDLLARATVDTTLLRQLVTQTLVQLLTGSVMIVGTLVMMGLVEPMLLLITLGVIALLGLVVGVVMPQIRRASLEAQRAVGQMGNVLERALGAFSTMKASGAEEFEAGRVEQAARTGYEQGVQLARWASVMGTAAGLAIQVAFLVVLGVGGVLVTDGSITVATLIAFLLYVLYLAQPVLSLVNVGTYLQAARAAVQRITEVTALPTEELEQTGSEPTSTSTATVPGETGADALVFEDVTFAYPGASVDALRSLSLRVPATGVTALVGPSGAGKSTTLGLVERFYDPDHGRILLHGRTLRDWPLRELRAGIGYVEQDAPVMAGTLRENLSYAGDLADDDDALHEALRVTRLDGLLERLGGNLDAEILERGHSLSGGERQRIVIARALLRRPRLLLLDEATSQLDAVNEGALRDVIQELSESIAVLVVAHRLSTVRNAAQIAVLENGTLRASGTHLELLESDELYAELAAKQLIS